MKPFHKFDWDGYFDIRFFYSPALMAFQIARDDPFILYGQGVFYSLDLIYGKGSEECRIKLI